MAFNMWIGSLTVMASLLRVARLTMIKREARAEVMMPISWRFIVGKLSETDDGGFGG
jgi:hypothetical protein